MNDSPNAFLNDSSVSSGFPKFGAACFSLEKRTSRATERFLEALFAGSFSIFAGLFRAKNNHGRNPNRHKTHARNRKEEEG